MNPPKYGRCTRTKVKDWSTIRCSRDATGPDGLCSQHRAGDRRSEEARARQEAERDERNALLESIRDEFPADAAARPEFVRYHYSDSRVVVNLEWLRSIMRRVKGEDD